MELKFYDENHKNYYMQKTKDKNMDCYNKTVIYLLSLIEDTRRNFEKIYNIEKHDLHFECLEEPWQTNTSLVICRLAFNLYGGFCYDIENDYYAISNKFNVDSIFYLTEFAEYFYMATCIRYETIK